MGDDDNRVSYGDSSIHDGDTNKFVNLEQPSSPACFFLDSLLEVLSCVSLVQISPSSHTVLLGSTLWTIDVNTDRGDQR